MIATKKMKMLFELLVYINKYRCKAASCTCAYTSKADYTTVYITDRTYITDGPDEIPNIVWEFYITDLNYEDLGRIIGRIKMDLIRFKKGSTFDDVVKTLPMRNVFGNYKYVDIKEFLKKGK